MRYFCRAGERRWGTSATLFRDVSNTFFLDATIPERGEASRPASPPGAKKVDIPERRGQLGERINSAIEEVTLSPVSVV